MLRLVFLLGCLSLSAAASADWAITGVRVQCFQALGQLRFSAETVSPDELAVGVPEKVQEAFLRKTLEEGLLIEGEHMFTCNLHGVALTARVVIYPPSERGECGANPGGYISIFAGKQSILSVPIGNACFRGSVKSVKGSGLELSVFCTFVKPWPVPFDLNIRALFTT